MIKTKIVFSALLASLLISYFATGCSQGADSTQNIPAENRDFKAVSGIEQNPNIHATTLSGRVSKEVEASDKKPSKEISLPKVASRGSASIKSTSKPAPKPTKKSGTTSKSKPSAPTSSKAIALDWWTKAQYAFPRGAVAKVTDVYTGKTFNVKRTYGTNHADAEALTSKDSQVIKSIWGGWSWVRRPIIVHVNGQRIAASMAAMPHAGLDKYPANQTIDNRSGDYGTGVNLDAVKGNDMNGVFDIHFLNSRTHGSNKVDTQHQAAIKIAVGK